MLAAKNYFSNNCGELHIHFFLSLEQTFLQMLIIFSATHLFTFFFVLQRFFMYVCIIYFLILFFFNLASPLAY